MCGSWGLGLQLGFGEKPLGFVLQLRPLLDPALGCGLMMVSKLSLGWCRTGQSCADESLLRGGETLLLTQRRERADNRLLGGPGPPGEAVDISGEKILG